MPPSTPVDEAVPNVLRYRPSTTSASSGLACVIGLGLLITLLLIAVTLEQFALALGAPHAYATHATIAFAVGLLAWLQVRSNGVSRWVRLCSIMLVLHLALLVAAYGLFLYLVRTNDYLSRSMHQAQEFSMGRIVLALGLALVGYLVWAARYPRHRAFRILRTLHVASLVFVLVLGLWAPIAIAAGDVYDDYFTEYCTFSTRFIWAVLTPPALASMVLCAPPVERWVLSPSRGFYSFLFAGLVLVFANAKACQAQVLPVFSDDYHVYLNCLPLLLGASALGLLFIMAMAANHWWSLRGRAGPRHGEQTLEGVVVAASEDPSVGRVHYEGWVQGLRMQTSAFVLRGDGGDVPIPAGSRLIASVPTWTIGASPGQSTPILRDGDRVVVHGLVPAEGGGPFRASSLPLPGPDGMVVVKCEESVKFWREFTLLAWRPTILFFAVGTIVAIPGLLGLLSWQ